MTVARTKTSLIDTSREKYAPERFGRLPRDARRQGYILAPCWLNRGLEALGQPARPMKCPFCGSEETQVIDTRANVEANTTRRRRKCASCEKRFTTYERVDLKMPRLVKKDGSRTDFDREKLMGSMMLALRKRPVATDEVEGAVDRVIERLRSLGEREVSTTRVGDFVMRELAKLDKIAYIRFASVYRQFETPDDFRDAVQEVKSPRKRRK